MSKTPSNLDTATAQEIEEALAGLTEAQLVRLNKVSAFRTGSLGVRAVGRNPSDILSDAIIRILEGRRKWIKSEVTFVPFLLGVMKSITSHIRTGKPLDAFDEIAPSPVNAEDDGEDSVEQIPTAAPVDPERHLLAAELDTRIRERFNDDPVALLVYEAFLEKLKPAEIQGCLGLSANEYNAAARRLRRAVERMSEGRRR